MSSSKFIENWGSNIFSHIKPSITDGRSCFSVVKIFERPALKMYKPLQQFLFASPTQAAFIRNDLFCICMSCLANVLQIWQTWPNEDTGKPHFPRWASANEVVRNKIVIITMKLKRTLFTILAECEKLSYLSFLWCSLATRITLSAFSGDFYC